MDTLGKGANDSLNDRESSHERNFHHSSLRRPGREERTHSPHSDLEREVGGGEFLSLETFKVELCFHGNDPPDYLPSDTLPAAATLSDRRGKVTAFATVEARDTRGQDFARRSHSHFRIDCLFLRM